jgi:light-independent protochlorophyllide reductase subunit N
MTAVLAPATTVDALPVLRERGQREVFCGLTGIIWLHSKVQDAFFLVVGSRTCAHLLQSAAGVMVFAEPRFGTAIIEERDLAGLADANEELDKVVRQLLARRPEIKLLFLVGSCPSEVIKLDLGRAAQRLNGSYRRTRQDPQLFGQRHRNDLHARRRCLPGGAGAGNARRTGDQLMIVGALPDVVEDQFRRLFADLGIARVEFAAAAPGQGSARHRPRHTLPAGPAVPWRHRAGARNARCPASAGDVPVRRRGHHRLVARRRHEFGIDEMHFRSVVAPGRERAKRALARLMPHARRQAIFFMPDSQLEVPLARFLRQRARHGRWSKSARPICTAAIWPANWRRCRRACRFPKARMSTSQLDRCARSRARPDRVRPRPRQPAGARRLTTKWAIELVFSPVHGFEQAGDLAELFARPLVRRDRLTV